MFLYVSVLKAQITENDIKATLILRFCENVSWNYKLPDTLVIGYMSKENAIYDLLKNAESKIDIQGRPIHVVKINEGEPLINCQAIYYDNNKFDGLTNMFNEAKDNNILLITDNINDELFVFINFIDDGNTVKFKVNMSNLKLAGFDVRPNLLLNGGSVVDVNAAYEKFEARLDKSKTDLDETRKALRESEQQITKSKKEIEKAEKLIKEKDSIILLKEKIVVEYSKDAEYHKSESDTLKKEIEKERKQLSHQLELLTGMEAKLRNLQNDIKQKEEEYVMAKKNLEVLMMESETLKREIEGKNVTLQQQDAVISSQKRILILTFVMVAALLISGFTLYRLFRLKKKHNLLLAQKVEERTKELQISNAQYQTLFNHAPVALLENDLSEVKKYIDSFSFKNEEEYDSYVSEHRDFGKECITRIKNLNVNKAALKLFRVTIQDEFIDVIKGAFNTKESARIAQEYKTLYHGRLFNNFQTVRFNKHNEKIEIIVTWNDVSPIPGSFSRVIISLVDITHLRQIEKELKKHQNELELMVKEKTEDLETANEELLSTNEELYDKNNIINNQNEDLKAMLQHLKETQSQLLMSEKMASLGVLTAGVAHEINNPLNFIMGAYEGLKAFSDIEKSTPEKERYTMLLDALKTGVDRASNIVKSLNQFSRENDNVKEECHIHEIINNCLTMLHNQLKNRVEVEKKYCDKDVAILGNVGNLHQVFINILGNAEQAIDGEGKITIKTVQEKGNLFVEITDTGTGIPEENISKITEPFFTTKNPGKGTGLGLSITYNIIKEHGGSLDFISKLNRGTTVRIVLPLK